MHYQYFLYLNKQLHLSKNLNSKRLADSRDELYNVASNAAY
jgi:hypothetical protein